jgi:hypothetical protein
LAYCAAVETNAASSLVTNPLEVYREVAWRKRRQVGALQRVVAVLR